MTFAPFDWSDFIAPLDIWVLVMAFVIGSAFGVAMRRAHPVAHHSWMMLSAGVVFYVPLAILRAAEDSPVWERFLATLILWAVFVAGMEIAMRWKRL